MDKNTLLGMLLMGLVLFGFIYCNRPEPNTTQNQTEEATLQHDRRHTADSIGAASLTPEFEARIAGLVREYGVNDGDGTYTLTTGGATLTTSTDTINTGKLSGTITLANKEIDICQAFNPVDTVLTLSQKSSISTLLSDIYNERVKYRDFAGLLDKTAAQPFTVENSKMRITFDPRGGRMTRVVLKEYKNENTDPAKDVELMSPDNGSYSFIISTGDRELSTAAMAFTPSISQDSTTVTMTLDMGADTWMEYKYSIMPDNYIVGLEVTQHNMSQSAIPANVTEMGFDWNLNMERNEVGRTFEERNSAIYYKTKDDSPDDLSANSADSKTVNGAVQWVAFKNQFFSSVVIPRNCFKTVEMESMPIDRDSAMGQNFVKTMSLKARFDYSSTAEQAFAFDFYLGPNSYSGLSDVTDIINPDGSDLKLQKLVPLGWGIFGWINQLIVIPLFNLLGSFIASYGIIILLLTIIIKIILFPFTYKSYMSQAKMRILAPEIKEINEKYPGQENAMKRQQETMKLYNRAGASPFSGCLPMLLQLPVLIALFNFFPVAIELRGQSFLWAHNLAAPDYICTLPFTIPFYGDKVSLFCLLMTATNIIYTQLSMASNPSTGMPGMKWMTYLMPIMFLFFFNDYASGLSYYYFISLLITIGQTYFCRHIVDEDKMRARMKENAKKPKKKSGFMARLEEAQKRQEAMMREQAKQRAKKNR